MHRLSRYLGRRQSSDCRTKGRVRGKYADVTMPVLPGRRDQRGNNVADHFERREDEVGALVGVGLGVMVNQSLVVEFLQLAGGEGRVQ